MAMWHRGTHHLVRSPPFFGHTKALVAFFHTTSPQNTSPSRGLVPLAASNPKQAAQKPLQTGCQVRSVSRPVDDTKPASDRSLQKPGAQSAIPSITWKERMNAAAEDALTEHLGKRAVPGKGVTVKRMGCGVENVESVEHHIRNPPKTREGSSTPSAAEDAPAVVLSQEECETLKARLDRILAGLISAEKTERWNIVIKGRHRIEWVEEILSHIPPHVGRILASDRAPKAAELLQDLPWEDTDNFGVYVWTLRREEVSLIIPLHCVYVGSATRLEHGLSGRRSEHESWKQGSLFGLHQRIRDHGLDPKGKFGGLLSLKPKSSEPSEVMRARHLVVLSEAVFTVWLGAFTQGGQYTHLEHQKVRELCPWILEEIEYGGLCSHNPLLKDPSHPSPHAAGQMALRKE